jgi:hypothetical protein
MNVPLRRGRRALALEMCIVAIVLALAASACGGSDDAGATGAATTSSSSPPQGSATIQSFEVPTSVQCTNGPSTTVTVKYATSGAASQRLIVDGRDIPGTDAPSGSVDVPVHCDALPHTVVLYLLDSRNRPTVQREFLETKLT